MDEERRKEQFCNVNCWPKQEVVKLHEKMDKVVIYMERLDAVLEFVESSPKYVLTLLKLGGVILAVCAAMWAAFHKTVG